MTLRVSANAIKGAPPPPKAKTIENDLQGVSKKSLHTQNIR